MFKERYIEGSTGDGGCGAVVGVVVFMVVVVVEVGLVVLVVVVSTLPFSIIFENIVSNYIRISKPSSHLGIHNIKPN